MLEILAEAGDLQREGADWRVVRALGPKEAETDLRRVMEALRVGADEYLMKPVTRDVLVDKLALLGLVPATADR